MVTGRTPDRHDLAEVRKAGKGLTMQAVTLSNRHIKSGYLKHQFIREIDRFEQCLVNDFERGKKSKAEVMKALKKEQYSLVEQSSLITKKGIGFIAGVMQVVAGGGLCYASATTLCFIGAPMVVHGANNVYENGKYFVDGDEDATGYIRKGYQHAAEFVGYSKNHGNMAYYGVDLGLSAYGAFAKTKTVKDAAEKNQFLSESISKWLPWRKTRKAKQFKLYSYSAEDYLRGYQASSRLSLGFGSINDGITAYSLYEETEK